VPWLMQINISHVQSADPALFRFSRWWQREDGPELILHAKDMHKGHVFSNCTAPNCWLPSRTGCTKGQGVEMLGSHLEINLCGP